jgi:hypothetical protein
MHREGEHNNGDPAMRRINAILPVLLLALPFAAKAGLIETFDDGDISDYTLLGSCDTTGATASAAHDGPYGLEATSGCWAYRDDAAVTVSQGDTISAWINFNDTADARAYFGFGASDLGTLSFVLAPNTGDIRFQENQGYGFTELDTSAQTFLADTWYLAEVIWGLGGSLTGNLYASDGITLLNSVTSASTLYSTGGIAFRGFGGVKAFDSISTVGVPEPGTLALFGLGLLGLGMTRRRKKI